MDSAVLGPLTSLETNLNSIITSLTQTNTFTNAPQLAHALVTDDDNLSASLTLLQQHQRNYARILHLRAEADTLQERLRATIRQCVALRDEIGQIHPPILDPTDWSDDDDDDDDNDEDGRQEHDQVQEIDYHTLLAFAARIGKHNAAAARESEAESERRKITARNPQGASAAVNGGLVGATLQDGRVPPGTDPDHDNENTTAETTAELQRINDSIAVTRAQMGLAFPDANLLRVGALGQLQLFAERQAQSANGDQAQVEAALVREVERMVRESEDVAPADANAEPSAEVWLSPIVSRASFSLPQGPRTALSSAQSGSRPTGTSTTAPPPKRKVDLDFPSSDEDDA